MQEPISIRSTECSNDVFYWSFPSSLRAAYVGYVIRFLFVFEENKSLFILLLNPICHKTALESENDFNYFYFVSLNYKYVYNSEFVLNFQNKIFIQWYKYINS